ncbi:MAG: hypothetical protein U1C49_01760 [Candidatus Andersenbacteria bacterium]|nr:hypothetical protein [bacterium]MDZ4225552.1 hypothetical protein [Candidatus Andersenbacteria bacterium]
MITQIGSLPYDNVEEAIHYSLEHEIPFLPELPKLGDLMLEYIKHPGRLSCLDEFSRHRFSCVKIQCVGPTTLVSVGYSPDEAVARIVEHVSVIMGKLKADEVILFLDEPSLGQSGLKFEELWAPIFESFPVTAGVHCCGNMDWDVLFRSDVVRVISFDASQFDVTGYPQYRGNKRIVWGVERLEDVKDFQTGDFLTLPCGMSPLKYRVEDCLPALKKLRAISDNLERCE